MKKPSVSIRFKLFAQVGAILTLAILAFLALNYWYLGDVYIENAKKNMVEIAESISAVSPEREDFSSILNQYENDNRILINVYSADGEFDYKSSIVFTNYSGRIQVEQRQENADGSHFEIQKSKNNTQYIVYYKPLENGGEIEMFCQKDIIDENVRVALNTMGFTAVIAVVVALLIIFIYSGRFTKPLIKMSEITKRMAKLDFSQKVRTKQNDEIGKLGASINDLSDSLNAALVDLNEKNKRLLDEVEQEKKLDRIRKSFVSNVSHELKTPISIIQGYAEGLKVMDNENGDGSASEYCDIIMRETEKMNELVLQLLELSSLESGGNQLNTENFNVSDFVSGYFKGVQIVLEEKKISHEVDVNPDFVGQGDKVKLNMVLNNYVSNAISHIDGERIIKVSAEDMGETYRIYVFNTGEHIKSEDIDNIWQSFYRADKSRSRSQGRFGLGLSIVSAICNLHETDFGVENVENGVRFYFDIKKAD